jgi:hypothetical protein
MDFKNHFWIQMTVPLLKPPNGVFRSEMAVSGFGSETAKKLTAIYQ